MLWQCSVRITRSRVAVGLTERTCAFLAVFASSESESDKSPSRFILLILCRREKVFLRRTFCLNISTRICFFPSGVKKSGFCTLLLLTSKKWRFQSSGMQSA